MKWWMGGVTALALVALGVSSCSDESSQDTGKKVTDAGSKTDGGAAADAGDTENDAGPSPDAGSPRTCTEVSFADFTAGLGTQAALERANYYSGGQTPVRYSTGLFAPKNAVAVK